MHKKGSRKSCFLHSHPWIFPFNFWRKKERKKRWRKHESRKRHQQRNVVYYDWTVSVGLVGSFYVLFWLNRYHFANRNSYNSAFQPKRNDLFLQTDSPWKCSYLANNNSVTVKVARVISHFNSPLCNPVLAQIHRLAKLFGSTKRCGVGAKRWIFSLGDALPTAPLFKVLLWSCRAWWLSAWHWICLWGVSTEN